MNGAEGECQEERQRIEDNLASRQQDNLSENFWHQNSQRSLGRSKEQISRFREGNLHKTSKPMASIRQLGDERRRKHQRRPFLCSKDGEPNQSHR
ncbi:hypothetical protein LINGRAHAP2_LOCUS19924 [Linum grandiflorum]